MYAALEDILKIREKHIFFSWTDVYQYSRELGNILQYETQA